MGNTHHSGASSVLSPSDARHVPVTFHDIHSENIQLSSDHRRARRLETFCKGICFSNRAIHPNERVFLRFAEVSSSWSGAIRFGFTSHDPMTISQATLPRYACPDLTNRPGFWAKALPERLAKHGAVLCFYFTPSGDVMFGINGEDKGAFFGGIAGKAPLWALVDVYGNTTAVEFVDGYLSNSLAQLDNNARPFSSVSLDNSVLGLITPMSFSGSSPQLGGVMSTHSTLPIRHISEALLRPFAFYNGVVGRNICLSSDCTVAVRRIEDYCNAYVFAPRPFHIGETVIVQILSVDTAYTGGLAFGMTCCNPDMLRSDQLPDDSDLFLDRPEYWIVNKDVCGNAQVGDELAFHLTDNGAVHYGRNGHHISTLMHIDKTLPMWAFFDVYGSVQKIKMLGLIDGPPPWERRPDRSSDAMAVQEHSNSTPPPRPPPLRSSPSAASSRALPTLPHKQLRPASCLNSLDGATESARAPFVVAATSFPAPPSQPVATVLHHAVPPASSTLPHLRSHSQMSHFATNTKPAVIRAKSESADNASNECAVCLERPSDCVLYTCGHMCLCYECAHQIQHTADPACPICRQPIRDVIKIFRT